MRYNENMTSNRATLAKAAYSALCALALIAGCTAPQRTQSLYPVSEADGLVASGYAVIASQRGDTPAQQRLMAIKASKLDAYRALAEQVYGQYVNATGTMADMSVTEDHLKSRVEGVIYGARVVSITPIGEETYETKLSLSQPVIDELVRNYMQQPSAGR
jgi:hypothetical protein